MPQSSEQTTAVKSATQTAQVAQATLKAFQVAEKAKDQQQATLNENQAYQMAMAKFMAASGQMDFDNLGVFQQQLFEAAKKQHEAQEEQAKKTQAMQQARTEVEHKKKNQEKSKSLLNDSILGSVSSGFTLGTSLLYQAIKQSFFS